MKCICTSSKQPHNQVAKIAAQIVFNIRSGNAGLVIDILTRSRQFRSDLRFHVIYNDKLPKSAIKCP